MTDSGIGKIQIGKNGMTENFLKTLDTYFTFHKNVKIAVLKSARESKEDTKKFAEQILEHLGKNYTAKVIGHTIALKKWRKERKLDSAKNY